jgi:general secretion pathway protein A
MYLDHYGLRQAPFNLSPDPGYLYLSSKHQLALSLLQYGLSEASGGLTVITGAVGAGKTTLLRKLLQQINYDRLTVGMINNTMSFDEHLIRWVVSAFNMPHDNKDSIAVFRDFQHFVINQYAKGKQTVLIIDEAQNLNEKSLEELRLLTNINAERDQLLKIVLIGQPELLDILSKPKLAQIAQRVSVEYHLEALTREETSAYVEYRMHTAGSERQVFTDTAVDAVYYLSGGVPRLINTLCDYALVFGYATDAQTIGLSAILEVIKHRRIGGVNQHAQITEEMAAVRQHLLAAEKIDIAQIKRAPQSTPALE